jgi:hypothetical protein
MRNNLIGDPAWVPLVKTVTITGIVLIILGLVFASLTARSSSVYAQDMSRTNPGHMSGISGQSRPTMSPGGATNCNRSTYVVQSALADNLIPLRGPEAKKWCLYFRSNTCSLPTVSFFPGGTPIKRVPVERTVKWFKRGGTEVFVMYPGFSGCKIFIRKPPKTG